MSKPKSPPAPWQSAPADEADTMAIKAMYAGNASDTQQKRALDWIMYKLCGVRDLSYRPGLDGDRETAFAEGKRFVGLQIARQIHIVPSERRTT